MKVYIATRKEENYSVEYRVRAENKEEAQKKIKEMCGQVLKVKEK